MDLAGWSVVELVEARELTDAILMAAAGGIGFDDPSRATERKLEKLLTSAWRDAAGAATDDAMAGLPAEPGPEAVNALLAQMGAQLKRPLTEKQTEEARGLLGGVYRQLKERGAREAKSNFSFSQPDKRAIDGIARGQTLWIGGFFETELGPRIGAVAREIMLQSGLGAREAGRELERALRRETGAESGGKTAWAPEVPARYAGNPERYWRELASTSAHQARTTGKITAFADAGFLRYQILNPLDERTGAICRQLAGKTFDVKAAQDQVERLIAAQSPDEVRAIQPWLSGPTFAAMTEGLSPQDAEAKLRAAGALTPPFHPMCVAPGVPVVTARGEVAVETVVVGDEVLTHRGRWRRVTAIARRHYSGTFISFVELPQCVLTSDHPVLEADHGYVPAGELRSGAGIFALRNRVPGVRPTDVRGGESEAHPILRAGLPQSVSREDESSSQRTNDGAGASHLPAVRPSIRDAGTARQPRALLGGVQGSVADDAPRGSHLFGLSQDIRGASGLGTTGLLAELSQRRDQDGCGPAGPAAPHGRQPQPDVWQGAGAAALAEGRDRAQREHQCSRAAGGGGGAVHGRDGAGGALRTGDVPTVGGSNVHAGLLSAESRFVDRDWGSGLAAAQQTPPAVCRNGPKVCGDLGAPDSPFASVVVGDVQRSDVDDVEVYDLTVEEDETFVAGGVVVHNCRSEPVVIAGPAAARPVPVAPVPAERPRPEPKPEAPANPVLDALLKGPLSSEAGISTPADGAAVENQDLRWRRERIGGKDHVVVRCKVTAQNAARVQAALAREYGGNAQVLPPHAVTERTKDGMLVRQKEVSAIKVDGVRGATADGIVDLRLVTTKGALANALEVRLRTKDAAEAHRMWGEVSAKLGITGGDKPPTDADVRALRQARLLTQWDREGWQKLQGMTAPSAAQIEEVWREAKARNPKIDVFLSDMETQQVAPGHYAQYSPAMARTMREAGVTHLHHQVGEPSIVPDIIAGDGLLSSAQRFERGRFVEGMSTSDDFGSGGADNVFARIGTGAQPGYFGKQSATIILDPALLGRSDWYAFNSDKFGAAGPQQYEERLLGGDVGDKVRGGALTRSNEVMLQHGVPVSSMRAVVVRDPGQRKIVLDGLRAKGITEINSKPIEQFVVQEWTP